MAPEVILAQFLPSWLEKDSTSSAAFESTVVDFSSVKTTSAMAHGNLCRNFDRRSWCRLPLKRWFQVTYTQHHLEWNQSCRLLLSPSCDYYSHLTVHLKRFFYYVISADPSLLDLWPCLRSSGKALHNLRTNSSQPFWHGFSWHLAC